MGVANPAWTLGFSSREFAGNGGRVGIMRCCSRSLMKCRRKSAPAPGKLDWDYWSSENGRIRDGIGREGKGWKRPLALIAFPGKGERIETPPETWIRAGGREGIGFSRGDGMWEWGSPEHPQFSMGCISPDFLLIPFLAGFSDPIPLQRSFSSNSQLYLALCSFPRFPWMCLPPPNGALLGTGGIRECWNPPNALEYGNVRILQKCFFWEYEGNGNVCILQTRLFWEYNI